jgi:hypothetical protein
MYFNETGECPEDPIALNDAFEVEYDSTEYEEKVSTLLRYASRDSTKKILNPSAHGMKQFAGFHRVTITFCC